MRRKFYDTCRGSFFTKYEHDELEYVARLASKRYKYYFHRLLDGLEFTINLFREHIMIGTSHNESNLVLILPKEINLSRNMEIIKEIDAGLTKSW